MSDRDHAGGGGLTGATGDLTFEENDRPMVTGEAREYGDAARRADVTAAQIRQAPAQTGDTGDPTLQRHGGLTNMAERDMGYASEHGLSAEDPAYRMERHPSSGELGGHPASGDARSSGDTVLGGDQVSEQPDHL